MAAGSAALGRLGQEKAVDSAVSDKGQVTTQAAETARVDSATPLSDVGSADKSSAEPMASDVPVTQSSSDEQMGSSVMPVNQATTDVVEHVKPSVQMGLNADDGALSAAAVAAVDGGAFQAATGIKTDTQNAGALSSAADVEPSEQSDFGGVADELKSVALPEIDRSRLSGGDNNHNGSSGGRVSQLRGLLSAARVDGQSQSDRSAFNGLPKNIQSAMETAADYYADMELRSEAGQENMTGRYPDSVRSALIELNQFLAKNPESRDMFGRLAKKTQDYRRANGWDTPLMGQAESLQQARNANGAVQKGSSGSVDIGGQYENTDWELREADDLGATIGKADNQFRDRTRQGSEQQVKAIADNLDYRKLGDSPMMDYGAPTLANDGDTVIGGNGRVAAIKQAYKQGSAENYRAALAQDASKYGFTPEQVGQFKQPVLVRRLQNPNVDIRQAAIASNEGGGLQMSSLELAKTDATRLPDLAAFQFNDSGSLNTGANRKAIADFVGAFPVNQRAALQDANGMLSREGLRRLENAMLFRAYGDSPTLSRLIDSTRQESRNVSNALTQASSTIAEAKADAKAGAIHNLDIADDLMQAADLIEQIKANGGDASDYLAQFGLFGEDLSEVSRKLLAFMDENVRSAKRIRSLIQQYYAAVRDLGNPNQADMFGESNVPSREQLLERVINEQREQSSGQSDLFEQSGKQSGAANSGVDSAVDEAGTRPESASGNGNRTEENGSGREVGSLKKVEESETEFARKAEFLQGEPVYTIKERTAPRATALLKQWAIKLFERAGGKAVNPEIGEVVLNNKSVKSSLAHGLSPDKAMTFEAIPSVIEKGVVVAETTHI